MDEKKLNEIINDEELESVAGGATIGLDENGKPNRIIWSEEEWKKMQEQFEKSDPIGYMLKNLQPGEEIG